MAGPCEVAGLSSSGLWEREDEPEEVLSRYRPEHQRHSQPRAHKHSSITSPPRPQLCCWQLMLHSLIFGESHMVVKDIRIGLRETFSLLGIIPACQPYTPLP